MLLYDAKNGIVEVCDATKINQCTEAGIPKNYFQII